MSGKWLVLRAKMVKVVVVVILVTQLSKRTRRARWGGANPLLLIAVNQSQGAGNERLIDSYLGLRKKLRTKTCSQNGVVHDEGGVRPRRENRARIKDTSSHRAHSRTHSLTYTLSTYEYQVVVEYQGKKTTCPPTLTRRDARLYATLLRLVSFCTVSFAAVLSGIGIAHRCSASPSPAVPCMSWLCARVRRALLPHKLRWRDVMRTQLEGISNLPGCCGYEVMTKKCISTGHSCICAKVPYYDASTIDFFCYQEWHTTDRESGCADGAPHPFIRPVPTPVINRAASLPPPFHHLRPQVTELIKTQRPVATLPKFNRGSTVNGEWPRLATNAPHRQDPEVKLKWLTACLRTDLRDPTYVASYLLSLQTASFPEG
ncbi:hypothetical protein EV127DRAFT_403513 [Xylaria flabelliformis]|nr:hypothetical protein EV127DRAFT_403513 [Xylaria flabelliformis]